jgi:hypothetical protein
LKIKIAIVKVAKSIYFRGRQPQFCHARVPFSFLGAMASGLAPQAIICHENVALEIKIYDFEIAISILNRAHQTDLGPPFRTRPYHPGAMACALSRCANLILRKRDVKVAFSIYDQKFEIFKIKNKNFNT